MPLSQVRAGGAGADDDMAPGRTVGVAKDLFVGALVAAFGFERRSGVERDLQKLYHTLHGRWFRRRRRRRHPPPPPPRSFPPGAADGKGDYREVVCGLRVLANPSKIAQAPRALLLSFVQLYSLPPPDDAVARGDVLRLIGMAAATPADLRETRDVLDDVLVTLAYRYGLKQNSRVVPKPMLLEALERVPQVVVRSAAAAATATTSTSTSTTTFGACCRRPAIPAHAAPPSPLTRWRGASSSGSGCTTTCGLSGSASKSLHL